MWVTFLNAKRCCMDFIKDFILAQKKGNSPLTSKSTVKRTLLTSLWETTFIITFKEGEVYHMNAFVMNLLVCIKEDDLLPALSISQNTILDHKEIHFCCCVSLFMWHIQCVSLYRLNNSEQFVYDFEAVGFVTILFLPQYDMFQLTSNMGLSLCSLTLQRIF